MSIDAKGYGGNDDRRQYSIQDRLVGVLDGAARRAGLDRAAWIRQPAGDGELSILPASEREHVVVDEFVRQLSYGLTDHNHDLVAPARLRLRLAIHFGVVIPAPNGYAGQGVVTVSRLVDSAPARDALVALPEANLSVILSARVFDDTVAQRHTSLAAAEFRRVQVRNKEYVDDAWLYVPGGDVLAVDLPGAAPDAARPAREGSAHLRDGSAHAREEAAHPREEPARRPAPASSQVTNEFHAPIHMGDRAVIGVNNA
ncbi:hypothetical protein AB0M43_35630 [Longispora sp. NPDC051575]|uniref:hypothetical protein n=1 Tax=Longispora sp. NPDC051575 TaxID=3154943 RepID=UPI00343A2867